MQSVVQMIPAKNGWNIDHDHDTDLVRGILCTACNIGIGLFKDSPYTLLSAVNYLQFTSKMII